MTRALSKRLWAGLALAAIAVLPSATAAAAQDLAAFEETTTVKVLDNGWTFIIVERPVAPVFSFGTYANVGSAQELVEALHYGNYRPVVLPEVDEAGLPMPKSPLS